MNNIQTISYPLKFTCNISTVNFSDYLITQGNYNLLSNIPWNYSANNSITTFSNIGIGKINPSSALDLTGTLSCQKLFINDSNLFDIYNSNVNVESYSLQTNGILSNNYYFYSNDGFINFPKPTSASVLLVGAGGKGGGFILNDSNIYSNNSSNIIIPKNSKYQINSERILNIEDGIFNIIFNNGSIILNNTNDNKYKILNNVTPVAWYKFDNLNNLGLDSINTYNLTNNNSVSTSINSIYGLYSASFNGTNQYLSLTNNLGLNSTNFTISFWVYRFNNNRQESIIQLGSLTNLAQRLIILYTTGNFMEFGLYGKENRTIAYANDAFNWVHWTFCYNFTNRTIQVYRNGVSVYFDQTVNNSIFFDNTFYIGTNNQAGISNFNGLLDDLRIYNVELTETQIQEIYNISNSYQQKNKNYLTIKNNNPIAWYRFDNQNNLGFDTQGNYHLTNNSTTLASINSLFGDYSSYYYGSGQNLSINNNLGLNNTDFTISFWVYRLLNDRQESILQIGTVSNNGQRLIILYTTGNLMEFGLFGKQNQTIAYPTDANKWIHWVFSYNYTNRTIQIYRNGASVYFDTTVNVPINFDNNFFIGTNNQSGVNSFYGLIDDLRIYRRQLWDYEIQGLYNVSTPTTIIQNTNSSYFTTKDNSYPILKDLNDSIINPLIWYKFDGDTITMLNDSSGNGYNLINNNATIDNANFIKGTSSVLVDSNKFLRLSENNIIPFYNIQTTNGISFSLWVRLLSSSATWGSILSFADSTSSVNAYSYIVRNGSSTNLQFSISNGTQTDYITSGINFFNNTWVHIVWCITKSGLWIIYIDGVNQNSTTVAGYSSTGNYNTNKLFGYAANTSYFINGNIDDFRIYNFELSPSQVQELYRGKVTIISPVFNNFGGGGAGEIIYYQNYNFNKGIYNIKIGKDSVTPILRDTYIYDSNLNGLIAKGGNDGEPSFNYIDSSIISIYNKTFKFGTYYNVNNTTYKYLSPGSYDFIFNQGTLIINNTFDRSYPNLLDSNSNIIKPLLWYKFNNSSNFTNDEYYSSNNLWSSNCTFSSDYFIKGSGSLAFNAEYSQFARVPHNINLNTVNTTTGISFSVWARFSTRAYSWSRIFDFGFPDSANPQISNNFIFIGIIGTGQNLRFQIYNQGSGSTYDHSTANFRDGNWHYYTWTISTTGVWNIYIDGELILSNSARIVIPVFTAGSQFYYLGKSLQQDNYLDGNIDDFRIYNKVLSQAEVTKLYKGECKIITFNIPQNLITSTTTLSDTYISPEFVILRDNDNKFINPIRWYKFDVNGLLLDSSGNNITASLNGTNASTIITLDTTNFIKGNASLNNTSVNNCYYKFALTNQPPISFCYWIRFNSFSSWCVFSYNSDNNISSLQMDISNLSSTTGFFYIYTALPTRWNVQVSGYSYQLYVNKWYFVTLTYSLNTTGTIVKLYINGNLIGTGTGVVGAEFPNIGTIYLGKSGDSGRGFDGKMDDVRVYDFELSDKQIKGLYYGNNYKINSNTLIKFNEESENYILRNNYNIINSNGNFAIGTYIQNIDRSYPILYDSNNMILNPILWYKFENSTNFENDSLNNPFNKLYNSKCIFHTSDYIKGSGSVYFNSSLYANLRIPNVIDMNAINKNKGISFSFWAKLNSSTTNWGRIFDFGQVYTTNSEVPSNYIRIAREGTGGNLNFRIGRAPINTDYGNAGISFAMNEIYLRNFNYFDGVWRHFIWSISPTGEWSIYVNGIMVYNINEQLIIPYFNPLYQYNFIGKTFERNQNANYYLNGYLDDFRIYDFVLTSNQVIELYNGNIKFTNTDAKNNAGKFLDDFNYNYAITSNTSNLNIPIKTSLVINNTDLITLTSNNYTINFNQGLTTVNNINLTSTYHILKNQESIVLNPIVWYKFDDNSTQMLLDNSGNNYNLNNFGATFDSNNFIKGNGSVNFSASVVQYIRVPDNFLSLIPIILNQQGISFTWWGRFGLGANFFERIFELGSMVSGSTTTTKASILCYRSGSSTDIAFMVYQKTPLISFSYSTSGINFFNNTWNHFVWTISNNGVWNIYVNGKAILINSANTNFPTNAFEGGDLLGFIGKAIHESYRLEGNIDDFRIYNFVLNLTQVQEIYNNSSYAILKTTTTTNLNPLVWYKFDDNSTQMLLDNSGNNYNLNNFGATFDSNNFIKGNGSIRFLTANNQYVSIPFIPFQNYYANGFTISFWFRLSASVNAYFRLISFFANGRGNNNNYIAIITTPNQTSLYIEMGTTGTATITANPTLNVWHHITWSIKNQTWISYYDGVLAFSGIKTGTYPTYTSASSENLIGLGYVSGSYTEYYTGNIDDFRIYDFELNANQIREIYNNGVNIYTNSTYPTLKNGDLVDVNPTVWYKFDNFTNLGNDSSPNNISLFNVSNVITSNDIIKGNYSARFNSNNYLNYNSNIVNSNGIVSFNSNYAYVIYPNDGSITFNQDTFCDVMLVGAGGRGGGNPNMDITLYQTTSNLTINDQAIIHINDGEYSNIPMGNYDFIFNNGIINVNKRIDRNYPQIKSGIIRQYPPKGYDSYSTEIAATISGNVSCRRTDITLTTTGITYGSGIYEIYSTPYSDNQGSEYTFNVFNADTGNAAGGLFEKDGYSTSTNFYVGSKYLVEDYKGSFIVIKLPVSIVLQNYKIFQRTDANRRRPNNFNLYGSTNGQTWTLLDSNVNAAYPSNVFQKFLTTNNTYFNYYGIVVNKILGTDGGVADTVTNFTEWQLFGYEDSLKDTTDPVLWYKFDDSTNIGKDELNKYNLTNTNCTLNNSTFIKGSSSVSFNGSSSYLTNTSFSSILSNKSFTISYFQYALSTTNGSSVQIGATSLNTGYWVGYGINNASQYGFSTWGGDMYSGNYTDTNQWVHVCFTYNSFTQERNIYRNGLLITTGTLASSTITNNIFYIGTLTTTTYMMNGLIDDFRIYAGVVLNQTQINQLYNNSTYYSNLTDKSYPILRNYNNNFEIIPLVWYQFDTSTNIGYDSTGNHNLTNNGTITLNTSDFMKGNASMSLNGTTQYLNKTGGFNFNNKNWTVSCWIKKTANGRSDGLFQFGDGTGQGAYVGIYYKSTNAISITFFNDDVDSANTYSDAGNWVHILLTYNYLTKIRRLYRNGIQIINNVSAVIPNTNTNIRIGILGSFYFQGLIDDFRFYDIELNVSQILELYNGRINITYPKLNNGSGAGGGGQITTISNYKFTPGTYNINIGIDSDNSINRNTKIKDTSYNDLIIATGGGDGGFYSLERRYPPKIYDAISSNFPIQSAFNTCNCFRCDLFISPSNVSYGGGTYEIYFSSYGSVNNAARNPVLLFDSITNYSDLGNTPHFATNFATNGNFLYTSNLVESTYNGEWILIKLPIPIILKSYTFYSRSSFISRAPKTYKIYGSTNGKNWATIDNVTNLTTQYYFDNYLNYTKYLHSNINKYQYYCLTVNQILGSGQLLNFLEWELKGIEDLSTLPTLNGGINGYNLTSNHRRYPPKPYTSTTLGANETIRTLNGLSVYGANITLDNTNITYGSGTYQINYNGVGYTNTNTINQSPLNIFNHSNSSFGTFRFNTYNKNTGFFTSNVNNLNEFLFENSYKGSWISIKLPKPIILTEYEIYPKINLITTGTHSITFNNGEIKIGNLTPDRSYPILKDNSGNTIVPINWFKFDNPNEILIDSGSRNETLTNNGALFETTDYIKGNGCLKIGTAGNNVQLPSNLNLYATQTSSGLSVSLWCKISSAGSYGKLMYFGNSNTASQFTIQRESTNNGLFFVMTSGTSIHFVPSFNPFSNIWFHIVWTISTSGYHNIYLNGVLQSLRPSGNFANGGDYSIRRIGAFQSGDNTIGLYDDFRIYDKELTQAQATELFKGRIDLYSSSVYLQTITSDTSLTTSSNIFASYNYGATTFINNCPKNFKIYGSNSGMINSWSVIDNVNQSSSSIYSPFYQKILTNNITYYDNYCLTVNQIFTGESELSINQLILYGIEDVINITSSNINGSDGNSGIISTIGSNIESFSGNNLILSEKGLTNQNLKNSSSFNFPIITGTYNTSYINSSNFIVMFTSGSDNTITINNNCTVDILLVGGGGGAGYDISGGGGSGAVLLTSNFIITPGTYSITVGSGGIGSSSSTITGANGGNSTITINGITYIALGGGGGGSRIGSSTGNSGVDGGSGGGAAHSDDPAMNDGGLSIKNNYINWISYGNAGGFGKDDYRNGYGSGGGGGAGSAGGNASGSVAGNGGTAINLSSLFGANVGHNGWFAGGGGGCSYFLGTDGYGNGGYGLLGGGGNAGVTGSDGLVNTGGGGGGSRFQTKGGNGGSGVVIIKFNINNFALPIQTLSKNLSFNMPTIFGNYLTSYINSDNFYVMFTSGSNNLISIPNTCKADILVVGGGGSGGPQIGGGGGGGAVVYVQNGTILSGNYSVTIGNGGNAVSTSGIGNKGNNSLFAGIIAEGGGPGNSYPYNGGIGGSGGGSGGDEIGVAEPFGGSRGTESSLGNFSGFIYGNRGGNGLERTGNGGLGGYLGGGGGGGAGEIGLNGNPNYNGAGGRGGNGVIINIIGSNVYWGAGGGGAQYSSSDSGVISRAGNGGLGGGGGGASASGYGGFAGIGGINNGGNANSQIGGSGGTNTGSGGGGGGWFGNGPTGGAGGSGVVIIKFNINDFMLPIPSFNKTLSRNMPSIFGNYFASYANSSNFYVMFTNGSNVLSLPNSYTTDILVIGGGGSGGTRGGGGGGAGALIYKTNQILNSGIYSISIGSGGLGQPYSTTTSYLGIDGNDTIINFNGTNIYIAKGGGGGAYNLSPIGRAGGSCGGNSTEQPQTPILNPYNTENEPDGIYGNQGGVNNTGTYLSGGGGGAGSIGGSATSTGAGNGGSGLQINITGINQWYAAGGGGSVGGNISKTAGLGGSGIGGNGGLLSTNPGGNGKENTGSGGGGGGFGTVSSYWDNNGASGSGGSGIVIIRFNINEFAIPIFERNFLLNISSKLSGNYLTSYANNSNFYVMFTSGSNNSITIPNNCTADIFLIGGGGGGGYDRGGGGGAGSAIIAVNQTLNPGIYSITVGNGGTGGSSYTPPPNGNDSEINLNGITIYRAKGGGVGGAGNSYPTSGGCGGGAGSQAVGSGGSVVYTNIVNRFTVNPNNSSSNYVVYGNKGGDNFTAWTGANLSAMDGAGGGGIGAIGEFSQKTANSPGKGGNGLEKAIINNVEYNLKNYFSPNTPFGVQSGSLFYIGGGGGGGNCVVGPGGATGGLGGGGNGAEQGNNGSSAIANTGSGGGGAGQGNFSGGAGGSGLVIIRLNINDFTLPLFAKSYGFGGFENGGIGTNGLVIIKTPIPNPNSYFIPVNFTIALWIKLNHNTNIKTIFSAKNFKDYNAGYELNVNNSNLEFAISTSNYLIKSNFISNTASIWQHLVFTYDNSNRILKCYINGVDINTNGFSIIAIRQFITDNYIIRLGGGQVNGTNIYNLPDGSLIDDFRIYDFILSSTQVQELYNGKVNIYYTTYGNSKGFDAPTSNINLFNLTLGAGGSGATSNSLPLIKSNYGIGGDGNNGNAGNGLVIIKINETVEEPKEFKGYVNWNNVININNIASNNLITVNENKQIKLNYNSNVFYLDNYNKFNISNITFSNNDIIYSGSARITNNIYSFSNLFSNIPVKQINNQIAVGIGITNPQSRLHLGYSSYSNSDILIKFTDNSTGHTIDNGMTLEKDNTSAGILWNLQNSNIIFQTNNSEIMRITSNGNIGIGIQNPTSILEINSFITVKRYDYRRSTTAAPTTAGNFAVCYTTLLANNNMSPSIITYTTNSGTGDTITINRKGIYIINAMVGNSYSGGFIIWLDKNEASNNGYGNQNILCWTSIGNYNHSSLVYTGLLNVNDVIRVKSSNIATFTASANHTLTITLLSGII